MVEMDGHRTAERRSLAYHAEIARRLAVDPSILERASAVARARLANDEHGARDWLDLLEASLEDIVVAITRVDERMTALRQMTPFVGVLDPRTRWQLWRATT